MNETEIEALQRMMERYGIASFHYEEGNSKISLAITENAVEQDIRPEDTLAVLAEATGFFLARHPALDEEPVFPRPVHEDEIVGWLKAGLLLRPVIARAPGLLGAPRVKNGALTGYGDQVY